MREHIASIQVLVTDAFQSLFEDAGRVTEANSNTKVILVAQTMLNRALADVSAVPSFIRLRKGRYTNLYKRNLSSTQLQQK